MDIPLATFLAVHHAAIGTLRELDADAHDQDPVQERAPFLDAVAGALRPTHARRQARDAENGGKRARGLARLASSGTSFRPLACTSFRPLMEHVCVTLLGPYMPAEVARTCRAARHLWADSPERHVACVVWRDAVFRPALARRVAAWQAIHLRFPPWPRLARAIEEDPTCATLGSYLPLEWTRERTRALEVARASATLGRGGRRLSAPGT